MAGGTVYTFELDGLGEARQLLASGEAALTDWTPALERMADAYHEHMKDVFDSGGAAGGARWPDLSPSYEALKDRLYPGRRMLERSYALRRSLTTRGAEGGIREVGRDYLILGSGVQTPGGLNLARLHHEGSRDGKRPPRPILTLPAPVLARWTRFLEAHVAAAFAGDRA